MCILPTRSKGNQIMNFGQIIEHEIRNIFLEKSYAKYDGKARPRRYKISKFSISLDQHSEMLCTLFSLYSGVYQNVLKLRC